MKNFELLKQIWKHYGTQGAFVRAANLRSETRLSRIIHGYSEPTPEEIARICKHLKCTPRQAGLVT